MPIAVVGGGNSATEESLQFVNTVDHATLLVRRYARASLIVTSNKSFLDWGEIFNDHVLATAILNRLLHYSTTLNIKGESYRLMGKHRAGLLGKPKPTPTGEGEKAPMQI